MRIHVIKIGKPVFGQADELAEMYRTRLGPFATIDLSYVKDTGSPGVPSVLSPALEKILKTCDVVVGLHEKGSSWSSLEFANKLRGWMDNPGVKSLAFLVGGPFGWDASVEARVKAKWCLSPCTLQGDVAWIVLWEQLYRASTILRGMPYHHA